MPKFKEYPRGNLVNGGQLHLPCAVLVDTSGSMSPVSDQLYNGLAELGAALDDQARGIVEFCIIGFDDEARILVPFGPAYDYEAPCIDCGGMTAMHAAVDLGLSELEARKALYKANNTPYYRPWMFLLTDGKPNDPDNGAFDRLIEAQNGRHCTFFPVAIGGETDKALLKRITVGGKILTATKESFEGAFVWLSDSMSRLASSQPDEKVLLANPGDFQIGIEVDA